MVGANVTGVPDVSLFLQLLVQRVDEVTGGASASYGSDAVGGVANFVTNKRFEGIKINAQGGITTLGGDDGNYTFQAAAGKAFLDDRLHVIVSGEYSHEDGVGPGDFGEDGPSGRNWWRDGNAHQPRAPRMTARRNISSASMRRPISIPSTA